MYKKSVGVILNNLIQNQLAFFAIHGLNNLTYNSHDIDCMVFIENISPPCVPPLFPVMDCLQIWNFNGLLISTTLENTMYSLKSTTSAKKMFYIWDVEWLRNKKDFQSNINILRNKELTLVTRSEDYADLTYNYCGIRPHVVEHFNTTELIKWI